LAIETCEVCSRVHVEVAGFNVDPFEVDGGGDPVDTGELLTAVTDGLGDPSALHKPKKRSCTAASRGGFPQIRT
jgi:hypothetical protein